ncbi:MAG: hypothetical protein ACT4PT_13565, partial [Methanobacteriota archaeon]
KGALMNAKVLRLVELGEEKGFEIGEASGTQSGGIRLVLSRDDDHETLEFAFYELPAIFQATQVEGVGG